MSKFVTSLTSYTSSPAFAKFVISLTSVAEDAQIVAAAAPNGTRLDSPGTTVRLSFSLRRNFAPDLFREARSRLRDPSLRQSSKRQAGNKETK